jgi:uncharacterized membrane-anchored protein YjiN (DUF445 family)
MQDEQTLILVESIQLNPNLDASKKLELVSQTLRDCQQKKIGKIITDAIERKTTKKAGFYPDGPLKKVRKKSEHSEEYKLKKNLSNHAQSLVSSIKADNEGRY